MEWKKCRSSRKSLLRALHPTAEVEFHLLEGIGGSGGGEEKLSHSLDYGPEVEAAKYRWVLKGKREE
jgi:hypothetical protein